MAFFTPERNFPQQQPFTFIFMQQLLYQADSQEQKCWCKYTSPAESIRGLSFDLGVLGGL